MSPRTTLLTRYEHLVEVATREEADGWLADFIGKDWVTPNGDLPTFVNNIDLVDGTSLLDAIDTLDLAKNKKMSWLSYSGAVVATNAATVKFSDVFSVQATPTGVSISISGNVIWFGSAESLEFYLNYSSRGTWVGPPGGNSKDFSGNRFAVGATVGFRGVGSISSVYAVVNKITLHGMAGKIGT